MPIVRALCALLVAVLLIPAAAQAQDDALLDQAQTGFASTLFAYPGNRTAQTFVAGRSGRMPRVRMMVDNINGTLRITLQTTNGTVPSGRVLATATVTGVVRYPNWTTVTFETPGWVNAGTRYALVVETTGTVRYGLGMDTHDGYPYGEALTGIGGNWIPPLAGTDLAFETYVASATDATAPVTAIAPARAAAPSGWYDAPVAINVDASDAGGSGVFETRCWVDPVESPVFFVSPGSTSCPATLGEGIHSVWVASVDGAGNEEAPHRMTEIVRVDQTVPATTASGIANGWTRVPQTVTLSAGDALSGVEGTYYTIGIDPPAPTRSSTRYDPNHKPLLQNGERIRYRSYDVAGNAEEPRTSAPAQVDVTPPSVSIRPVVVSPGNDGWSRGAVLLDISPNDTPSGVAGVRCWIDRATAPDSYDTAGSSDCTPTYSTQGVHAIWAMVRDVAGNESIPVRADVKLDSVAPSTTASGIASGYTATAQEVTLTASDATSGVAATYYTLGADPATPTTASAKYDPANKPVLRDGQRIRYFSVDVAGNEEGVHGSAVAHVDSTPPTVRIIPTATVPGDGGWSRGPVDLNITALDDQSGIVGGLRCWVDPASPPVNLDTPGSQTCTARFDAQGTHTIWATARDGVGNDATPASAELKLDSVAPSTTASGIASGYTATPQPVTLTASDATSGVAATYYTIGVDPVVPTTASAKYDPADKPVLRDGERIRYLSVDVAGNVEEPVTSAVAHVDGAAPTTRLTASGTQGAAGWWRSRVDFTLEVLDDGGAEVAGTHCWTSAVPVPTSYDAPGSSVCPSGIVGNGSHTIWVASIDAAGNGETPHSYTFDVDRVAPETTASGIADDYTATPQPVTLTASDATSGVEGTYYTVGTDPAEPTTASARYDAADKPVLRDGERIRYFSVDVAGNAEAPKTSVAAKVDTAAPVSSLTPSGMAGDGGWWRSAVTLTVRADDDHTDVAGTRCWVDPATDPGSYAASGSVACPETVDGDGTHGVWVASVDGVGNAETPHKLTLKLDRVAPRTQASGIASGYTATAQPVTLTASDATSGVAAIYYTIGTDPAEPTTASDRYDADAKPVLQDGERIRFFAVDNAGNGEDVQTSEAAKVDGDEPQTTIDDAPPADTPDPRPEVEFSSAAPDATFECSLDDAEFDTCASPYRPADPLADGPHTVRVRAVSRSGVADPSPAEARFTVDTVAPVAPVLTATPPETSVETSATVAFEGEPGATFLCSLDGAEAAVCNSPLQLTGLSVGTHRLTVVQADAAGNRSEPSETTFAVVEPQRPAAPSPTPSATPTPPPAAEPPVLAAQSLTLALRSKARQLLLDKNAVPLSVGCGGAACRIAISGRLLGPRGASLKLRTLRTTLKAKQKRRLVRIPTTAAQRKRIRTLVGHGGTNARVRFALTATGSDGKTVKRTITITLRRIPRA